MGSAPLLWVYSSRNFLHIFTLIHSRRSSDLFCIRSSFFELDLLASFSRLLLLVNETLCAFNHDSFHEHETRVW